MGQVSAQGNKPFESEDGVVKVANAGAVLESPIGILLSAEEIGDKVGALTQQFGRQPRDLQHFEPQTHCTSPSLPG
jgi:hypothetical protein